MTKPTVPARTRRQKLDALDAALTWDALGMLALIVIALIMLVCGLLGWLT